MNDDTNSEGPAEAEWGSLGASMPQEKPVERYVRMRKWNDDLRASIASLDPDETHMREFLTTLLCPDETERLRRGVRARVGPSCSIGRIARIDGR
jgi:hypothetical protein